MNSLFLHTKRIKCIGIAFWFSVTICYGQKDTTTIVNAEKMKRPIIAENDFVKFEIPNNDFIVFNLDIHQ